MPHRAYTTLELRAVDDEKRIIEGIASTPETDRVGDIVEPKGAAFTLPIPLLWQHKADQPIGHVVDATVTKTGIRIKATIAKNTGIARIDEAWQLIKSGLVRGLSIGFNAIETEQIKGTFGLRFLKWEWLELSAVTIPANADASIASIKSLDRAALGAVSSTLPGASGSARVVSTRTDTRMKKKTLAEQIQEAEASRASKDARQKEIMAAAAERGETLDPAEQEEWDGLQQEIDAGDAHITRLRVMEKRNRETTDEVVPVVANPRPLAKQTISVKSQLTEGRGFAAAVLCRAYAFSEMAKGNFVSALDVAKARYPDETGIHQLIQMGQKTAVAPALTSDSNWATALLEPNQVLVNEFLEYLRPRTLIGQFGTNGVPALTRVPFNVTIQSQTTGASASWVGQGKAKPLTKFNSTTTSLAFTKIAAIAAVTDELARFSRPGAEGFIRDELARAVIERMDLDFIDPAKAVSSGVNPASITNGVTPGTTAGTSAANAMTDITALVAPFIHAKYDVSGLVILMPSSLAFALSLMLNTTNSGRVFPDININGGRIGGIPVLTSQYLASGASYGNMVVVVHAPSIALADDGSVRIDVSRETSLQMDDAPSMDGSAGTGASVVSMFQTNMIAIRAEREVNWKKLRSDAVTFYDDVNWGSVGSPV